MSWVDKCVFPDGLEQQPSSAQANVGGAFPVLKQTLTCDLHCTVGLADVLAALPNLLTNYKSGLRITKLQEFLLARDGVDLEKFSIGQGYKDALEFLETQMPELNIHYREDRLNSVVKLPAGTEHKLGFFV